MHWEIAIDVSASPRTVFDLARDVTRWPPLLLHYRHVTVHSRMKAADVDYVNAHASSTPLGDAVEARVIARALGVRAKSVPVSGTKAYYGHPLGASGAIEAQICSLAIARGWAPGTVNLVEADPQATEFLPNLRAGPLEGTIDGVLSTSFGFGGLNAALAFQKVDG